MEKETLRKTAGKTATLRRVKQAERKVEEYLVKKVERNGGRSFKFVSPSRRGVPDRLVFMPKGAMALVECKATGKKPTAQQLKSHELFRSLGYYVAVVDHTDAIDALFGSFGYDA